MRRMSPLQNLRQHGFRYKKAVGWSVTWVRLGFLDYSLELPAVSSVALIHIPSPAGVFAQCSRSTSTVIILLQQLRAERQICSGLVSLSKTMWILILLMCSLPVSGALWAEKNVKGVVGRAITIDCHYAARYRSHTKYWCHGWTRQCSVLVEKNGQPGRRGRTSITDNPKRGIFTVTVEDLHSGDTGWYSCGISNWDSDPMFNVHLQVSDEPVSVPVFGILSPANVSRLGGSVSVSCESLRGSLPIQYTWYEKTPSVDSKVSDTSKLDLHCQSFKHRHHQYYCTASNNRGAKSSEMVNVTVFKTTVNCSYGIEINGTVSGGLWAEKYVRGVVGRAITIDCHYAAIFHSHTKSWCRVQGHQCTELVQKYGQNDQYARRSITDNTTQGIFTVTMEKLGSGDTGWYRCGITTPDKHRTFDVHLQVSDEPVSVPVLGFQSLANCEDSVTVTCESVQGSLPITYAWYEKTPSVVSSISNTSKLDLHFQSLEDQLYQYYCTASNVNGTKSSEMVNVFICNNVSNCRNVIKVNSVVSGALWAEKYVRGVVGRAITIDCHYTDWYRSHTKYWCHGWTIGCSVLVETNGQHGRRGRVSITDNPARGIFTVTMEDLHSGDTGWYSCGIAKPVSDPLFSVHLQVSDEAVSVPVLGFLSPANVSRLGGSVSVSCESLRGSLPIQYTWYEKTPSVDSKVSDTSKLDLHCQSFKHRHHQYYCTASNNRGAKSSEMVSVMVSNTTGNCSYGIEINGTLSGVLWGEKYVRGVVGRAIAIDCHYAAIFHSHTKSWCRVWGRQCTELVQTHGRNGQYGRRSIVDNPTRGIFTVTMEKLGSEDTGWYRCGITTPDKHPMFDVHLQVSDEPVSVPVLGFQSVANASYCEDSVTVTCESIQGSLPITYAWHEKTPSVVSNISNTSKLDLHCQSLKDQHYQYYCTASNANGTKSSEMVNVSICNNVRNCRNVIEVNSLVSGALWAEKYVRGVVGRAITIDCHYAAKYRSHTKYWCRGWTIGCSVLVETNGQHRRRGRVSITDNPARGIFTVTVEDLHSGDTGWYSCGITVIVFDPLFNVHLQVSDGPENSTSESTTIVLSTNEEIRSNESLLEPTQSSFFERSIYIIVLSVSGILLMVIFTCLLWCLKRKNRKSKCNTSPRGGNNEIQELAALEGNTVYETPLKPRNSKAAAQMANNENGIVYAELQMASTAEHSVSDETPVTYIDVKFQSNRPRASQKVPSPGTPQDSAWAIYATVALLQWEAYPGILESKMNPQVHFRSYLKNLPFSFRCIVARDIGKWGSGRSDHNRLSLCSNYRWRSDCCFRGWSRQCSVLSEEQGQRGRVSITDNPARSIFTVTVEDLHSGDTGWYSCGITTPGLDPMFPGHLQVSDVSGALWAEKYVRGVVGRAITIDCHYAARYRSHSKYWCHGWTRQCSVLVETNGQHGRRGRVSITDNPARGIFTVTVEDLHSGDTGWYSCGITTPGLDPMFHVHLQVSDEPVSVPVLGFLSPANVSCVGGSVSVSCESVQGSLPIQYTWYEKTPSRDLKISDTSKLDLRCQSSKQEHHQYYCTASNNRGAKSSEMVNVTFSNRIGNCSYLIRFHNTGPEYSCETSTTQSITMKQSVNKERRSNYSSKQATQSVSSESLIDIIVLSTAGVLLIAIFASLLWHLKCRESKWETSPRRGDKKIQELAALEGSTVHATTLKLQNNKAAFQLPNNENGIVYAAMQFQRKSSAGHSVTDEATVTYADVKFQSNSARANQRAPDPGTPQNSAQSIYATVAF
ncbi:uncharacterized protein LOC127581021 [Pristis pectinata]|uniref:uncharacterized protein LOC127581021 n=1 Tax=Pristis pectinata TaxID=685728 RepID=UPI00223E20D6|nr:uncharacterized protein LOC127581021 [Pristis pectinata]